MGNFEDWKSTVLETYNMFNCGKVKNNEVRGYLFFTRMSRSGAIFLHLPICYTKVTQSLKINVVLLFSFAFIQHEMVK